MNKKKLMGIILIGIGFAMFIISLSLFSAYSWIPPLMIKKVTLSLFSKISVVSSFPAIIPISGIMLAIFSLSFFLYGASLFPIIVPIAGIMLAVFSLFSILSGINFFHPNFGFPLGLLLLLILGLICFLSSIFLFRSKSWARKLVIIYSTVLIFCLIPYSIYLFCDPWGWGGL